MSDIELVIKISKKQYSSTMQSHRNDIERFISKEAMMYAIKNGTPLPKGHGDLIDRNSVDDVLIPRQDTDTEWCATGETIKQLIRNAFKKAPTIIEADKAESER